VARILTVEDDPDISAMLGALLAGKGYEPHAAYSGSEAVMLLEREHFDLVLLDLMLPGRGGLEVLAEMRAAGRDVPVIVLTAVTGKDSVVGLLSAGANDYLTKPFDNAELLARIQVQLRAGAGTGAGEAQGNVRNPFGSPGVPGLLRHKNLVLDTEAFDVLVDGRSAGLSKTEYGILKLLMSNPRKVFTKDSIYEAVWGGRFIGDDNTVNVHISKLRAKLATAGPATDYITTVWGIGFKMS
jgi:DNA-binding response OmpR family regulator